MTISADVDPPSELRTPNDWYALGQEIFHDVVGSLTRYGVHIHPQLRFVPAESPTPYYAPAALTIGFGIPDPTTVKGRLYWYFLQHLVGAANLSEVQTSMEMVLPWTVAHEVMHHLRHHYQAPIESDFVEEQVVNSIAIALLGEHPRYRDGLRPLHRWADRVFTQTRSLSPETAPYLAGFRLDIGEVLVTQDAITRATLVHARQLAEVTGAAVEEVLLRTGRVSVATLDRGRAEHGKAETYFNERYMVSLSEYWLFGTEWLARYLERNDLPSLGEALERHLLTQDWEASHRDATRLLLEQSLRSDDAAISVAAAEALASQEGADAIPALLAALVDLRPSVQATVLHTLSHLPGGPAAGETNAKELLAGEAEVRGAAARLLRLAGTQFAVSESASPAELAELALARLANNPKASYETLGRLLEDDEAAVLVALEALQEVGVGPLADRVVALLEAESARVRRGAVLALAPSPATAADLIPRLIDVDPEVRRAARTSITGWGPAAWSGLAAAALSADDTLRVEVVCLASLLGAPDAARRLKEIAAGLLDRAARIGAIEAGATRPGLEVLAQALGEERRRLAQLGVRALGQAVDPSALELAERLLASPDSTHRAGGRELIRHGLGSRGEELARLLEPGELAPSVVPADQVLAACAAANSITVRALAAFTAPRVLPPARAPAIVRRFAADLDPLVRSEAESGLDFLAETEGVSMLTTVEKLMYLRAVPTFTGCELSTLHGVAEKVVVQVFDAGEVVVREGEPGQDMFVVTQGRIKITVGGRLLEELGPRQYFGEMALFDGGPRSATASALEATTLLKLDRDDFYQLGHQSSGLLIGVIQVLSGRLREAMARASATTTTHPDEN
jgi:HEAT repeat protein